MSRPARASCPASRFASAAPAGASLGARSATSFSARAESPRSSASIAVPSVRSESVPADCSRTSNVTRWTACSRSSSYGPAALSRTLACARSPTNRRSRPRRSSPAMLESPATSRSACPRSPIRANAIASRRVSRSRSSIDSDGASFCSTFSGLGRLSSANSTPSMAADAAAPVSADADESAAAAASRRRASSSAPASA